MGFHQGGTGIFAQESAFQTAPISGATRPMFFFFSNRLGCAGSLLLTLGGSLVLLFLMGLLSF